MIELFPGPMPQGVHGVRQTLVSPAVYLDTWAIREFAESPDLAARFRTALRQVGGTLVMSDINLVEFSTFDNPSHTQAAGRFFESVFPQIFLMRCDPTHVVQKEEAFIAGNRTESPAGDSRALAEFAEVAMRRGGRRAAEVWFNIVYEQRHLLRTQLPSIAKVFYDQVDQLRARLETEPTLLKLEIERQNAVPNRPPTISLMRVIIKNLQADHSFPKDPNSAVDLLHTIVPGAWCTFVLLDRQWCARLKQASQQLAARGVKAPVARAYTKKDGGIESFLTDLAAWRPEANANETASPTPP